MPDKRDLFGVRRARAALTRRTRRRLGIVDVDDARVDEVYRQLAVFNERLIHLEAVIPPTGALEQLRADVVADMNTELMGGFGQMLAEFGEPLRHEFRVVRSDVAFLRAEQQDALLTQRVWATMTWIDQAVVPEDVLVSVVLPTRDRVTWLARAIASVRAQTYGNWELLVVDDGSTDGTAELLAAVDDIRVRPLRTESVGVDGACNAGLAAARGTLIAYLDDDNAMHRGWLRAVVWAFTTRPDVDVIYGAQIREDALHLDGGTEHRLPWLTLAPFDRRRLEQSCFIDRNAIAHRAGLTGAMFNADLRASGDWDLALRLTETRPAYPIPALANFYSTTAHNRLTGSAAAAAADSVIRARVAGDRSLRVLAFNALFPLITETYIGDEANALARAGAELAYVANMTGPSPMPVDHRVYRSLAEGIEAFAPDLLLLHWEEFALTQIAELEQVGLPFAVRAHSFDFNAVDTATLLAHPQCLGVWAYPHHAAQVTGATPLPTLLTTPIATPVPGARRDIVMSVSAGLMKKDWPLLIEAMRQLPAVDRRIVVGVTLGSEQLPGDLFLMVGQMADPPLVQVNLAREQILTLLQRTALLVYTLDDSVPFGNPISVTEAMASGASIVLPDIPEARLVFGPQVRTYRTAEDIAEHARAALTGGADVEAERVANRQWAEDHFMDPTLGKEFHRQLAAAYDTWRTSR